jgi:AcrR family transcriptional regulator
MALDMKEIIAEKFSEISKYKSIDKITVTELVKACNISRQAFYYHFRDIMDVVIWLSEQRIQDVLEYSLIAPTIEDAIGALVSFFSENQENMRKRLDSEMHQQYEQLINRDVRAFLEGLSKRSDQNILHTDFEAALDFCTGGVYAMLLTHSGKSEANDAWLTGELKRLICGELSLL